MASQAVAGAAVIVANHRILPLTRRVLAGHIPAMATATVVSVVAKGLGLAQPLIAGRLVDVASNAHVDTSLALWLGAVFFVQISAEGASRFLFDRLGEQVVYAERYRYARHLIDLPVRTLDQERVGDLVSRGTADTSHLRDLPRYIGQLGTGMCTVIVAVILMLRIDIPLGLTVTTVLVVAFPLASLLIAKMQTAALTNQRQIGNYGASLERSLSAIRTIKLFGTPDYHASLIGRDAASARRAGTQLAVLTGLATPVVRVAATGSLMVVLVMGGNRVADGSVTVGQLVTLFLLTLFVMGPLQDVYDGLMTVRTIVAANHRVAQILSQPSESDSARPRRGDVRRVDTGQMHVRGTDVTFHFDERRILDAASFALQRNAIHALVGPSGAGKSTLLAQLCRFYEPDSGELWLDGRPFNSYPVSE